MKIKQVLLSLLLISIVFSCSRKPKQEEKINTIESIKKEEQLTVDKEKLKQLSITISIDSIDKLPPLARVYNACGMEIKI